MLLTTKKNPEQYRPTLFSLPPGRSPNASDHKKNLQSKSKGGIPMGTTNNINLDDLDFTDMEIEEIHRLAEELLEHRKYSLLRQMLNNLNSADIALLFDIDVLAEIGDFHPYDRL